MKKFSVILKKIIHSGSIGKELSFKIIIHSEAPVKVGAHPNNKKIGQLITTPKNKKVLTHVVCHEKDKISDFGETNGTLTLNDQDEFREQTLNLSVQGVGGDKRLKAKYKFIFFVDFTYYTSSTLYQLIEKFEHFKSAAYRDQGSSGYLTIGVGHRIRLPQEQHLLTAEITRKQAYKILKEDVQWAAKAINDLVKVPINQNKFDALVSLVFNIGRSGFAQSRLLKSINNNASITEIKKEWLEWNTSKGKILGGLVKRRKLEFELFLR